jgi:hypothetical protein
MLLRDFQWVYPPPQWWIGKTLLAFILFAVYLEMAPGLGGIWIRPNSDGHLVPSLSGFWKYLLTPFQTRILWYPKILDANWIVFVGMCLFVSFCGYQFLYYYSFTDQLYPESNQSVNHSGITQEIVSSGSG